jgi:hypothetical protein
MQCSKECSLRRLFDDVVGSPECLGRSGVLRAFSVTSAAVVQEPFVKDAI